MSKIFAAYCIPDKIVIAIMVLYNYTESIVKSSSYGFAKQYSKALDYALKMSLDRENNLGFTLAERKSRR